MDKNEAMKIFNSLTAQQKEEVLNYMKQSKFWRIEQQFRETYWWFPMAISATAAIVSIIALLAQ